MAEICASAARFSTGRIAGLKRVWGQPYKAGASHIRVALVIIGSKQPHLATPKKIKAILIHSIQGLALCTPLVNLIIWLALLRFDKMTCKRDFHSGGQQAREANKASKQTAPMPRGITDLPVHVLHYICSYADVYDLGRLARVNRLFYNLSNQEFLWGCWTARLRIPLQEGENPCRKLKGLLEYFKIDRTANALTILKKPKSPDQMDLHVKEALAIYPFAACLLIPSSSQHYHFFYKDFDRQIHLWRDIDIHCAFSSRLHTSESVLSDERYVNLKLEITAE